MKSMLIISSQQIFSIFFGSSILQGRIKNENLKNVETNNCLLNNSLFLLDLKRAVVSYTEENTSQFVGRNY